MMGIDWNHNENGKYLWTLYRNRAHIGEVVLTSLKHKLRRPLLEYYIFIVATLVYTNHHIEIIIFIFTINNIYKW
jgi:hypothetical protein